MNDSKPQSETSSIKELVAEVTTIPKRKVIKKKPRVMNPNSLKNLKSLKPGDRLNPSGFKGSKKDRQLLKLSNDEMNRLTSLLLQSTLSDLEAIRSNPNSTMLELALAAIAARIVQDGDAKALETLINRPLGKPTETINVNNSSAAPQVIITLPSNQREVTQITTPLQVTEKSTETETINVKPKLAIRYGPKNG